MKSCEKSYEEGKLDGIKGIADDKRIQEDPEYEAGFKEGEARVKVFLASTEDHVGLPPVGRVIALPGERPVPLPVISRFKDGPGSVRPAKRRLAPRFIEHRDTSSNVVRCY